MFSVLLQTCILHSVVLIGIRHTKDETDGDADDQDKKNAFDGLETWESGLKKKGEDGTTTNTSTAVDPDQLVTGLVFVYEEQFFAYLEVRSSICLSQCS